MPNRIREELMRSASEQTLRKRWSFFERVFRSRPGSDKERAGRHRELQEAAQPLK